MNKLMIVLSLTLVATLGCKALPPEDGHSPQKQSRIITVSVGETFNLSSPSHSSVGLESTIVIKDDTLAKQIKKEVRYNNPDKMKEGYTGGDASLITTTFKAVNPGQTQVEVNTLFRGELQDQRVYTLKISPAAEKTE